MATRCAIQLTCLHIVSVKKEAPEGASESKVRSEPVSMKLLRHQPVGKDRRRRDNGEFLPRQNVVRRRNRQTVQYLRKVFVIFSSQLDIEEPCDHLVDFRLDARHRQRNEGTGQRVRWGRRALRLLICATAPLAYFIRQGALANRRTPNLAFLKLRGGRFGRADFNLTASSQESSHQQRAFVTQTF